MVVFFHHMFKVQNGKQYLQRTQEEAFSFLQIKELLFQLLSSEKMTTTDDIISISVLVGSIVDRLEIGYTDVIVSISFLNF